MRWGRFQFAGLLRTPAMACVAAICWASASLGATVTFEPDVVATGTRYGEAFGQLPGGPPVLSQDGINMSVERLITGSTTAFVRAEVGGRFTSFFDSTPLELAEIAVVFSFEDLAFDVTSVTLEVRDFGGIANFAINGGVPLQLAALEDLPRGIAPGFTAVLLPETSDPRRITIFSDSGEPIRRFLIGGQELGIDNITAIPEPTSLVLLGIATAGLLGSRRRSKRA